MMNIFSGRRFLDVISFGLLFLLMAPRLSFAQASEMESLRAVVKDMQQQMQKALDRIDQLEKEKAADSAKIGQVEKSVQAVQSAPSILNPAIGLVLDATCREAWERRVVISIFVLRNWDLPLPWILMPGCMPFSPDQTREWRSRKRRRLPLLCPGT